MENDPRFCVSYKPECAVWHRDTTCKVTREASDALVAKTLFAIKTCKDHHDLRLPTVLETWAPAAQNIIYVSEVVDPKYGTVVLPGKSNFWHFSTPKKIERVNPNQLDDAISSLL